MTFHWFHRVRGAIFTAPRKFRGTDTALAEALHMAVALGLSQPCFSASRAAQPELLQGQRTEPEGMDVPTRFGGPGRVSALSLMRSHVNWAMKEGKEGRKKRVLARRKFGGTPNTSLSIAVTRRLGCPTIGILSWQGCGPVIENCGLCCGTAPAPSRTYQQLAGGACSPDARRSGRGLSACFAVFSLPHSQFFPSTTGSTRNKKI